jgi:hypothetical protein
MPNDTDVVLAYLNAIAAAPDASDEDLTETLLAAGLAKPQVLLAVLFVPLACGRLLMAGLGIRFSSLYVLLSADGTPVERGTIDDAPIYIAAQAAAAARRDLVKAVALRSAEVNAVNQALNAGSNPANLAMAPIVAFAEGPTELGASRARALLTSLLADMHHGESQERPAAKAWWRFW